MKLDNIGKSTILVFATVDSLERRELTGTGHGSLSHLLVVCIRRVLRHSNDEVRRLPAHSVERPMHVYIWCEPMTNGCCSGALPTSPCNKWPANSACALVEVCTLIVIITFVSSHTNWIVLLHTGIHCLLQVSTITHLSSDPKCLHSFHSYH